MGSFGEWVVVWRRSIAERVEAAVGTVDEGKRTGSCRRPFWIAIERKSRELRRFWCSGRQLF